MRKKKAPSRPSSSSFLLTARSPRASLHSFQTASAASTAPVLGTLPPRVALSSPARTCTYLMLLCRSCVATRSVVSCWFGTKYTQTSLFCTTPDQLGVLISHSEPPTPYTAPSIVLAFSILDLQWHRRSDFHRR